MSIHPKFAFLFCGVLALAVLVAQPLVIGSASAAELGALKGKPHARVRTSKAPPQHIIPSIQDIEGHFYTNEGDKGAFAIVPPANPSFIANFPAINFNPPASRQDCAHGTHVNELTRPLTDVIVHPDGSCAFYPAQRGGAAAGLGNLYSFAAVFQANIVVTRPGVAAFAIHQDDGTILSIGPESGFSAAQPTYVSGPRENVPASHVGPFTGYPVISAQNIATPHTDFTTTVNFPIAGIYPFELDYTECFGGQLTLTMIAV